TTPDQVSSIPAGPARNNSPIHTDRSARTGNPAPESHPALSNGLLTPAPSSASQTTSADQTASAEPPGQENESSLHRSATGNIAKTGAGLSGNTLGKARPVYPKWITDHLAALHPAAKAPYRASVWQAGFAGGGGLSTIHQHLSQPALNSLSSTPSGTSYNFLSARDQARAAAAAAAAQKYASRIQPDFSFWAGIFAQRPVGKKLSLSVGLNLHYYSTIVETGKQITAPYASPVTSSLFYSTAVVPSPSTVSYPYYPAGTGSRFTNQYYFLELPVSVQWQLNSGRKMPIFWEGGLSVSRLMSASALSYDGSAGVYYKTNGGSAQTTQVSASTAFMIGLSRGATRIQFGPQLQYGLTSLSNGSTGGGQHLLYGGLKFTLIPGQRRGTLAAR
ncbi:MAG TPA: hypothetical protein VK563_09150, partial [Puia sp.]|nr:hypothetical protein [Puia sp.]